MPDLADANVEATKRHFWERTLLVWMAYGVLFCGFVGIVLLIGNAGKQSWLSFGLWVLWFTGLTALELGKHRANQHIMLVYFTVGLVLWAVIASQNQLFLNLLGVLFPAIFRVLDNKWAAIFATTLSILWPTLLWLFHDAAWWQAYLVAGVFNIGGFILSWFIYGIIRQSISRHELLENLKQTQAELAQAKHREGILEERRRLAGELHDTIAQSFTSVVIHLEAAEASSSANASSWPKHIQAAKQAARKGLSQTRDRVWALRTDLDQDLPLDAALRRVCDHWEEEKNIRCQFLVTGKPRNLPPDLKDLVVRCVKECLLNVYKHAQASLVVVTVSYMVSELAVDVVDDGNGMALHKESTGYGLVAMRNEIHNHRGELSLESQIGEGVVVAISLPLGIPAAIQPESRQEGL